MYFFLLTDDSNYGVFDEACALLNWLKKVIAKIEKGAVFCK